MRDRLLDREYIAYHEAAHAIAHFATRRSFINVAIVADPQPGQPAGYVLHRTISAENLSIRGLTDYAFISLVGLSHDTYRYGTVNGVGYRHDIGAADHYLSVIRRAFPDEGKSIERKIMRHSYSFVRRPLQQARIEQVAQALLEHGTLTYRQVKELLKK